MIATFPSKGSPTHHVIWWGPPPTSAAHHRASMHCERTFRSWIGSNAKKFRSKR